DPQLILPAARGFLADRGAGRAAALHPDDGGPHLRLGRPLQVPGPSAGSLPGPDLFPGPELRRLPPGGRSPYPLHAVGGPGRQRRRAGRPAQPSHARSQRPVRHPERDLRRHPPLRRRGQRSLPGLFVLGPAGAERRPVRALSLRQLGPGGLHHPHGPGALPRHLRDPAAPLHRHRQPTGFGLLRGHVPGLRLVERRGRGGGQRGHGHDAHRVLPHLLYGKRGHLGPAAGRHPFLVPHRLGLEPRPGGALAGGLRRSLRPGGAGPGRAGHFGLPLRLFPLPAAMKARASSPGRFQPADRRGMASVAVLLFAMVAVFIIMANFKLNYAVSMSGDAFDTFNSQTVEKNGVAQIVKESLLAVDETAPADSGNSIQTEIQNRLGSMTFPAGVSVSLSSADNPPANAFFPFAAPAAASEPAYFSSTPRGVAGMGSLLTSLAMQGPVADLGRFNYVFGRSSTRAPGENWNYAVAADLFSMPLTNVDVVAYGLPSSGSVPAQAPSVPPGTFGSGVSTLVVTSNNPASDPTAYPDL